MSMTSNQLRNDYMNDLQYVQMSPRGLTDEEEYEFADLQAEWLETATEDLTDLWWARVADLHCCVHNRLTHERMHG